MLRPFYRTYDLPWSPDLEEEAGFRRLWQWLLAICLVLGFLVWLIDVPEPPPTVKPALPPRLAKIVIERELPPPPPPPPPQEIEQPKPQEQVRPTPTPEPQTTRPRPSARERAARAGLLAFQDDLADIRQQFEVTREQLAATQNTIGAVDGPSRAERSLITSKVGASSGGISMAGQSRGFGSGAGNLGGHSTTQVNVPFAERGGSATADGGGRQGSGGKATRSREEIELVFDRNKGAIYALYNRALRDNPTLQGKLVLRLTIAPSGQVIDLKIVSSELRDAELEQKLALRIKRFDFGAKDVDTVTVTYPIEFFPS